MRLAAAMGAIVVRVSTQAGDEPDVAMLNRTGFRCEGVFRERVLKRGVFRDVWMFGFTRADWLRAAQAAAPSASAP